MSLCVEKNRLKPDHFEKSKMKMLTCIRDPRWCSAGGRAARWGKIMFDIHDSSGDSFTPETSCVNCNLDNGQYPTLCFCDESVIVTNL